MKEVYTQETVFQITGDPNSVRVQSLASDAISKMKERTYDLVITDSPDYATVREQELDMLMNTLPQISQLGPGIMKFALELTNLRNKKGLQQMLDQLAQPQPVQPKMSLSMTWADLSPEEKAYIALQMFQDPQLAQILVQQGGDPAYIAKIKGDLAKTQIKEGTRAGMERGRLNLQAMQTAAEGMLKSREIDHKHQEGMQTEESGGDTDTVGADSE